MLGHIVQTNRNRTLMANITLKRNHHAFNACALQGFDLHGLIDRAVIYRYNVRACTVLGKKLFKQAC